MVTLIPILGDQLSLSLSSLAEADQSSDVILMAEVMDETDYVPHHPKKIAFIFAAMRHFAIELEDAGWTVRYVQLDDPNNSGSLQTEIERAVEALDATRVRMTVPGEWRLRAALEDHVTFLPDTRFLTTPETFATWAEGRKELRMEFFYREIRRSTGLLMDGDQPVGGKWNYDADNRKPARGDMFMPQPAQTAPDEITKTVLELVASRFDNRFGTLNPFWFAVTRDGAEAAAERFMTEALPHFGDYQDAMLEGEAFLYHSVLAQYLNAGLLDPLALCRMAEGEYHAGRAPLNAVEGYIRQIIGWREFVRGIYEYKGPDYVRSNFFNNTRALPQFYWSADTDMACIRAAVTQTRDEAYAHHIQRLMVTGNFALIAGIDPYQVHEWYLAVYADAYEWVEAPNTVGMALFADGGVVGSKPYAASGAYINRMSDHCKGCRYTVKDREGDDACPFNALYWDFLLRNRDVLGRNPRLGQIYRNWARMAPERQEATLAKAAQTLERLDAGERL